MSSLGDLIRLDPATLAELRTDPKAYLYLCETDPPQKLELDKAWRRLAALLDTAGLSINPITGGAPFPDEQNAWDDAYWLTPQQVAEAAAELTRTPFAHLEPGLAAALLAEGWLELDDALLEHSRIGLTARYAAIVPFFQETAADGLAMVFWAA
jgi:hypothetical protein